MWPGPYGEWGSRKYLLASLDQSLKRMGLDYVDIFYSHRFDPDTPLEETMGALDTAVRQGKALYVGISSYSSQRTHEAAAILKRLGTPAIIHQPSYSIVNRWTEEDQLLDALEEEGMGCIVFSPLAQGLLTDKYLKGVPADSRAGRGADSWKEGFLSEENLACVRGLNDLAKARGQTLAQMALAWVLRDSRMTSALIGASRVSQIEDAVKALDNLSFTQAELDAIDELPARPASTSGSGRARSYLSQAGTTSCDGLGDSERPGHRPGGTFQPPSQIMRNATHAMTASPT